MFDRFLQVLAGKVPQLVMILSMVGVVNVDAQNITPGAHAGMSTGRVGYVYLLDDLLNPKEYDINGTPYYKEEFAKGQLYSDLGKMPEIEMKYNIFFDRMEYYQQDTMYAIVPNLSIDKIVLDGQTFVVENFEGDDGIYPTYFVRLDSGSLSLLTKMEINFKDRQQGKPIQGDVPAQYQRMPDKNYLRFSDGTLKRITSKKKLIQCLPDHKKEMEKYAKENKLSVKNNEELIKFTQYYNSLQ